MTSLTCTVCLYVVPSHHLLQEREKAVVDLKFLQLDSAAKARADRQRLMER
jgi:hypothetical protein